MERRDDWLAQTTEPILDPRRDIVDPHHHLWVHGDTVYDLAALWSDTGAGHNVVQTVYVECRSFYGRGASTALQPVGETAHVARLAAGMAQHPDRAQIAGIVAHADLRDPNLDAVLDAHRAAGGPLFKGIRHSGAYDPDPAGLIVPARGTPGLYADPDFRRGVARLGARGLSYDTWHYHTQTAEFLALAQAVPDTVLVLDHLSTPLGVGRFAGRRDAIFDTWRRDMAALAKCPNVVAKLGGLAMPDNGWGWHLRAAPPGSEEIAQAFAPWFHHMIDHFGPARCMFESNFPVDRTALGYPVLWNAFKRMAAQYDQAAQAMMFSGTARATYRL